MFRLYGDSSSDDEDDCNQSNSVPFPSRETPLVPASPPLALRPQVPRTTSSPILLSNGKPLKPSLKSSLKSSSSSPALTMPAHCRARSEPSTPLITPKNVHFPSQEEGGLVSVCLFNRSAKPASLSKPSCDDTETETETEPMNGSSAGGWPSSGSYFRSIALPHSKPNAATTTNTASIVGGINGSSGKPLKKTYDLDYSRTSAIPRKRTSENQTHYFGNVHLESVQLRSSPKLSSSSSPPLSLQATTTPSVTGSILVRNVAFEKHVAVRFTLDDWQTTSEVTAHYMTSLAKIPDEFVRATLPSTPTSHSPLVSPLSSSSSSSTSSSSSSAPPAGLTMGDLATRSSQWDRFGFTINLEDYAFNLDQKTMWLVVRYTVPTLGGDDGSSSGEWWDNNSAGNFRIGFRVISSDRSNFHAGGAVPKLATPSPPLPITRSTSASAAGSFSHHQKFFSYPHSGVRPTLHNQPQYRLPLSHHLPQQHQPPPSSPQATTQHDHEDDNDKAAEEHAAHQAAVAQTTLSRLKKLNLRNYAAPTPSPGTSPTVSPISSRRSSVVGPPVTMVTPATPLPTAAAAGGGGTGTGTGALTPARSDSLTSSSGSSAETTPISSPKVDFLGLGLGPLLDPRKGGGYHHELEFGLEMGPVGGAGGAGGMEFQDGAPATPVVNHHNESIAIGEWGMMSTSPPFSSLGFAFAAKHRLSPPPSSTTLTPTTTTTTPSIATPQSAPAHPPRRVRRPSPTLPTNHGNVVRSSLVKSIGSLNGRRSSSSSSSSDEGAKDTAKDDNDGSREKTTRSPPPPPPIVTGHMTSLLDVIKEKSTSPGGRRQQQQRQPHVHRSSSSGSGSGSASSSDSENGIIYTRSSGGSGSGSSRAHTPTPTQSFVVQSPQSPLSQSPPPMGSPAAMQVPGAGQGHGQVPPESVYQAFVRQWCFAHGGGGGSQGLAGLTVR